MHQLDPSIITIHQCKNGNTVLQFGVTMIHLQPETFLQFADMIQKTSCRLQERKTTLEVEMAFSQPGEA